MTVKKALTSQTTTSLHYVNTARSEVARQDADVVDDLARRVAREEGVRKSKIRPAAL